MIVNSNEIECQLIWMKERKKEKRFFFHTENEKKGKETKETKTIVSLLILFYTDSPINQLVSQSVSQAASAHWVESVDVLF